MILAYILNISQDFLVIFIYNLAMGLYLTLFTTFFKIGAFSFGGGYAMLPLLTREIVDRKQWCSNEELLDYFAIAQVTPGVIAVNTATFIGYKQKKLLGGIIATLGVITPSIIIIIILANLISNFNNLPIVIHALNGIRIAVAVLMLSSIIKLFQQGIKDKLQLVIYFIVLILVSLLTINNIYIVITLIILGLVIKHE